VNAELTIQDVGVYSDVVDFQVYTFCTVLPIKVLWEPFPLFNRPALRLSGPSLQQVRYAKAKEEYEQKLKDEAEDKEEDEGEDDEEEDED